MKKIARALKEAKKKLTNTRRKLGKKLAIMLTFFTVLLLPHISMAEVQISEVLYDPLGTETGGEAVELYNPGPTSTDISGWTIRTEGSTADATLPAGAEIAAGRYYLITDSGWSSAKDNASWSDADHEEPLSMYNTDSGVALVDTNGTIVDVVGWGDPTGITDELYAGTPASHVTPGMSLIRVSDTGNNSADFAESSPDLQNAASNPEPSAADDTGAPISVSIAVLNTQCSLLSSSIVTDDDDSEGVQIQPVPLGTTELALRAVASDQDGISGITATAVIRGPTTNLEVPLYLVETLNSSTGIFNTTVPMEFYYDAGEYNVTFIASDGSTNSTALMTFEYMPMTAIYVDTGTLSFPEARPGGTFSVDGDFALSTSDAPSVRNIGNTQIDFGLYGDDLTDGTKTIPITTMRYSFDNDYTGALSGSLSSTMQLAGVGLMNSADSVTSLGFQISLPASTQNGNYTGNIRIVAVRT